MKVCIDGLSLSHLQGTGLYTYTFELLDNLFEMYPQPEYSLIWNSPSNNSHWKENKNLVYEDIVLNRKENDFALLEEYIIKNKISIYHSPNNGFSIPYNKVCKYIITVHDMSPLSQQQYVDEKYSDKFLKVFPNAVDKADKIVAVSEFIKKELINYKVAEKKIEVIYPGCSKLFSPICTEKCRAFVKDKYQVDGEYLLYAGSIHPRKNLHVLLKVFKEVLKYNNSLKLVIVGKYDAKREEYYLMLKRLIRQLGIHHSVIFTGTVNYEYMSNFYSGCLATINLSEYDGFPITAIEAAACNSPVICSKTLAFEEALGHTAVFVDNKDINLIKDTVLDVINNKNYRTIIADAYSDQLKKYKWEDSVKKLVHIYESAVYGD